MATHTRTHVHTHTHTHTGYDCPIFPGVYEYMCAIAGSSLAAADILVKGEVDVAINWYGGWHHGKK